MFRKILWVVVLSLIVSAQALTVNCDLRCSLMGVSTGGHLSQADMQMPHCHGMSMERDKQTSVTSNGCCPPSSCGAQLKAIAKNAGQNDAGSSRPLVLAVIRFV